MPARREINPIELPPRLLPFLFMVDLFDDPRLYNGRGHVLKVITGNGGEITSSRSLSQALDLRFPLNLEKVLKYAVLVSGTKLVATQR